MHQSVVECDVMPSAMTAVSPGTEKPVRVRTRARVTRQADLNDSGQHGPGNATLEALASYLTVAGIAFGLVAAWAALCAI